MKWRIFTYGKWRTSLHHRWPSISACDVCDDNPPFHILHRWYQLSWFGMTLNLDVPATKTRKAWFFETWKITEWLSRILA